MNDQRETERQQQTVKMIELVEAREHRALDQHAECTDDDRRDQQRPPVTDAGLVQQKPRAERTHHVLRAVGEIDDVEEPKDHREAERQHRVERAVDEADEQLAKEGLHRDA